MLYINMLSHGSEGTNSQTGKRLDSQKKAKGERCIMIIEWDNVLSGVIVLTLCCGLLLSFGLTLFYSGKMINEIVSGGTDYIVLFQKMLIAIGIASLFYMTVEIFLKRWGC